MSALAFPASFSQQRLLFLHLASTSDVSRQSVSAWWLRGALDRIALQRSLNEVVARHEALRTSVEVQDGRVLQIVVPAVASVVPLFEVRGATDVDRKTAALRLAVERARLRFDLSTAPLVRVELVRVDTAEHLLVVVAHRAIADCRSLDLLVRELGACYRASSAGVESELPRPELHQADFAVRQHELATQDRLSVEVEDWRKQLEGFDSVQLPTDWPRRPVQEFSGETARCWLDEQWAGRWREQCLEHGCSMEVSGLCAFAVLLARLSGSEAILVGVEESDTAGQLARSVGQFENLLPFPIDLSGDPTWADLWRRVGEVQLRRAHLEMPFEKLVEGLGVPRDPSRPPLFAVTFAHRATSAREPDFGSLESQSVLLDLRTAQFELSLTIADDDRTVRLDLEYSTSVLRRSTIDRWQRHLRAIIEEMVTDPTSRVGDCAVEPSTDAQLWTRFNATALPMDSTPVTDRVSAQARRTPDKEAVRHGARFLSYAELDGRANQLAHQLRDCGVGPEVRVGVLVGRSEMLPVLLLAVLKVGGAYVPLDPSLPPERLRFLALDAGIRVVFADRESTGLALPVQHRIDVDEVSWVRDRDTWRRPPPGGQEPTTLAYAIYTSGSTGIPKLVGISRGSLANLLLTMSAEPGLGPSDSMLSVTTLSFDIATLELLLPPFVGARLVVADRKLGFDGERLAALLRAESITVLQATPTTWRLLLASGWSGGALRAWCGGEVMTSELARALCATSREVWNLYGPTETTIWSSAQRIEAPDENSVAIGHGVGNTQLHVLDGGLRRVPIGAVGELYIGGHGVARGYLGQPRMTAERFLPDPFDPRPGARLYRTGDRVRMCDDGALEFLGRVDDQVKIRGVRIELGEIESTLSLHPKVRAAAVVADTHGPRAPRLVGFVVASGDSGASEFREWLRDRLPPAMVPSVVQKLDALPLTPSGKVDRLHLKTCCMTQLDTDALEPPRTQTETRIAEIVAKLLDGVPVGRNSDFFALGGHSLLATRLMDALANEFSVELDVREFFLNATVSYLAASIDRAQGNVERLQQRRLVADVESLPEEQLDRLLSRLLPEERATETRS